MSIYLNKEWLAINVSDFDITEIEEKFIRSTLRYLIDLAPTKSSFKLEIERYNNIYQAKLTVKSFTKTFVSISYNRKLYSAINGLKNDMLKEFESWKESRFLPNFDRAL